MLDAGDFNKLDDKGMIVLYCRLLRHYFEDDMRHLHKQHTNTPSTIIGLLLPHNPEEMWHRLGIMFRALSPFRLAFVDGAKRVIYARHLLLNIAPQAEPHALLHNKPLPFCSDREDLQMLRKHLQTDFEYKLLQLKTCIGTSCESDLAGSSGSRLMQTNELRQCQKFSLTISTLNETQKPVGADNFIAAIFSELKKEPFVYEVLVRKPCFEHQQQQQQKKLYLEKNQNQYMRLAMYSVFDKLMSITSNTIRTLVKDSVNALARDRLPKMLEKHLHNKEYPSFDQYKKLWEWPKDLDGNVTTQKDFLNENELDATYPQMLQKTPNEVQNMLPKEKLEELVSQGKQDIPLEISKFLIHHYPKCNDFPLFTSSKTNWKQCLLESVSIVWLLEMLLVNCVFDGSSLHNLEQMFRQNGKPDNGRMQQLFPGYRFEATLSNSLFQTPEGKKKGRFETKQQGPKLYHPPHSRPMVSNEF